MARSYRILDRGQRGVSTNLIASEAQRAGIDPRIMESIRAGESGHGSKYDVKNDSLESSSRPFQLNRRRGLGQEFERDTGLDVRNPSTIPAQARWVAEYIKKHHGTNNQWMGYRGPRNADPKWGNSGYKGLEVGELQRRAAAATALLNKTETARRGAPAGHGHPYDAGLHDIRGKFSDFQDFVGATKKRHYPDRFIAPNDLRNDNIGDGMPNIRPGLECAPGQD
jgi:hypothetical protein